MTEEELREKLLSLLKRGQGCMIEKVVNEIITLIRKAGYKSEEEVDIISSDSWGDGFEAGQDASPFAP